MKINRRVFQEERLHQIREYVQEHGRVTVDELVHHFNVSAVTIRKDLTEIEKAGGILRTHGGAIASEERGSGFAFFSRLKQKRTIKQRIAMAAADMVSDGDVIFLDASTTVYEMCPFLTDRHALTVITISLSSAYWLATNTDANVVVVGGNLKRESFGLIGGSIEDAIRQWTIGKTFMGCWGLTVSEGLTDTPRELVGQKRIIARASREVIVLADSSKWGNVSLESFCGLRDIEMVISDCEAPGDLVKKVEELGVRVSLV